MNNTHPLRSTVAFMALRGSSLNCIQIFDEQSIEKMSYIIQGRTDTIPRISWRGELNIYNNLYFHGVSRNILKRFNY